MKNNPLKILIIVLVCSALAGVLWNIFVSGKTAEIKNTPDATPIVAPEKVTDNSTPSMCYYNSTKTKRGLFDTAWLVMNIKDNAVTGEFHNIPAEKDSKIGIFEGTIGPIDEITKTRLATLWWDSQAEGMSVTEELVIEFGDTGAQAGFGVMLPQGDDVYTYKDKSKIIYGTTMATINCEILTERLITEKYIKDNINTIATDKPVLGGKWMITSISIDTSKRIATIVYEDGHIQSKGEVEYSYDRGSDAVTVSKFTTVQ